MAQCTRSTPHLPPLSGKPILLGFDGTDMSSDAGLILLRQPQLGGDSGGGQAVATSQVENQGAPVLRRTARPANRGA